MRKNWRLAVMEGLLVMLKGQKMCFARNINLSLFSYGLKEIHLKKAILLVALLVSHLLGGCSVIYTACARFFDPEYIAIDFVEGKEIDLQFEVVASCYHNVGIGFKSKSPGSEMEGHKKIKNFFGEFSEINLPAEIDITVADRKKDTILNQRLGGKLDHYYIYGPNPVKFIAGYVNLPAGVYHVKIKVNKCYKDFHEFEVFFFASQNLKLTCG